ncbi:shikimate kinase [Fredinandcohnia quinoae]|uniref:Shikimate kinase n=1 Tax=Fredinandcohnia quinoae TaxID=2918902 RepID=A0AAW5E687_9BACI|nr:shikimate kinase [Fredinandcohnia sp. SECRCQ15]MCH1624911.1 shikimate kinase [Fredinandcohnia sp. SECRCQ15]
MKAIYITGFMGAGKTSIGDKLAEALNVQVIDTDHYIEQKVGEKIAAIFSKHGEQKFRAYEQEFLKELPTTDIVVTTGGGIITQAENRNWMKQHGKIIYLHCEIELIFERLKDDTTRPLFDVQQREKTIQLFHERLPLYREADFIVDTTFKNIDQIIHEIIEWLDFKKGGNND